MSSKDFFYSIAKLEQILATSLREEQEQERKREEWEKRDFGIVTIPRVDV
jgi:hypothetical protein